MEIASWILEHSVTLLQSIGIIGGLFYTARSFRFDAKVRRVANLLELTSHHHRIWSRLYNRPELVRVRSQHPDLIEKPITKDEELFVTQVILHLASVFRATKEGVISRLQGADKDVQQFFSKPIPNEVWQKKKEFQEPDFSEYIETLLLPLPTKTSK